MYYVRKMKLGKTEQLDSLSLAAGELYTKTLVGFWRVVRKKNIWLIGENQVVGVMASPIGIRYEPHMQCSL